MRYFLSKLVKIRAKSWKNDWKCAESRLHTLSHFDASLTFFWVCKAFELLTWELIFSELFLLWSFFRDSFSAFYLKNSYVHGNQSDVFYWSLAHYIYTDVFAQLFCFPGFIKGKTMGEWPPRPAVKINGGAVHLSDQKSEQNFHWYKLATLL